MSTGMGHVWTVHIGFPPPLDQFHKRIDIKIIGCHTVLYAALNSGTTLVDH